MTMSTLAAANFITYLVQLGVQLKLVGDRLQYRSHYPLTPALINEIRQHKPTLTRVLCNAHRWRATQVIRAARRSGDRGYAITLRDAWRERVAICVISGNSPLQEAYQIAMAELESVTYSQNMTQ